jgi:hypothetical protein
MNEKNEKRGWKLTVSLPFDWQWSKNRIWKSIKGKPGKYLAPHARQRRDALATLIRAELTRKHITPWKGKLWLALHVEIPNHRGDPINCLDLVADAVQDGTGINDRWFWLNRLTWENNSKKSQIMVSCGQYGMEVDKK